MIRLTSQANITQVLSEGNLVLSSSSRWLSIYQEYATEADVDFVCKYVRVIGRHQGGITRFITFNNISTFPHYLQVESIIAKLCKNLGTLDEPEARAGMIWIIGEYAERWEVTSSLHDDCYINYYHRIDNADELLESFLETFHDENSQVQLQSLPEETDDTQELVQQVLSLANQESENPDLRDRGFIYWRLLSTDPAAAKEVVLAEKSLIADEADQLEPTLLDELICHIASLASVYHKPPQVWLVTSWTWILEERLQCPAVSDEPRLLTSWMEDWTSCWLEGRLTPPCPELLPTTSSETSSGWTARPPAPATPTDIWKSPV